MEFASVLNSAKGKAIDATTIEPIRQALELYQGDFLADFYVRQAPDVEAWMLGERARLRQLMIHGLGVVAAYFANQGDVTQAIAYTRRLLAIGID